MWCYWYRGGVYSKEEKDETCVCGDGDRFSF